MILIPFEKQRQLLPSLVSVGRSSSQSARRPERLIPAVEQVLLQIVRDPRQNGNARTELMSKPRTTPVGV